MLGRSYIRIDRHCWRISVVALFIVFVAVLLPGCTRETETSALRPMFAVAMSLRDVMPVLIEDFTVKAGFGGIDTTYGGSGSLRQQVEGGAPVDGVIFANRATVDDLIERGHANAESRVVIATNRLVLIGPKGRMPLRFDNIETIPGDERIAIGDPASVPAGRYAQQALQALGKWPAIKDRLVFGGHVAAVLQYARRGEVSAAVVYGTEIRNLDDIVVLDEANGEWAPRAEVVAAVVKRGTRPQEGRAFVSYLSSGDAQRIFREFGFGAP